MRCSGLAKSTTVEAGSRDSNLWLALDEPISASGLGPAWIMPLWYAEVLANEDAAAISS